MNVPKRVLLPIIVCVVLTAGGCADQVPIERTAFISLIGIDVDPDVPAQNIFTFLVARPGSLGSDSKSGGGGQSSSSETTPFYIVSSSEPSWESAAATRDQLIPRKSTATHLHAYVISEERASRSVGDIVDRSLRNPTLRETVLIVISKGHAQVLLDVHPALEPLPGNALTDLIQNSARIGLAKKVMIHEFARKLLSPRLDPVAPYIERGFPLLDHAPADFSQQPVVGPPDIPNELRVTGLAVFKGDKMVGTLMGDDARAAVWVFGSARSSYAVPRADDPHLSYGINVTRSSSKIEADMNDGRVIIDIHIKAQARLDEVGLLSPRSAEASTEEIASIFESAIKKSIENMMVKVQKQYNADIFGIADTIFRQNAKRWPTLKDQWDDLYAEADVNVHVNVEILTTGLLR